MTKRLPSCIPARGPLTGATSLPLCYIGYFRPLAARYNFLLTAGLHGTSSRFCLIRPITVYQGKNYHGGENDYAKTGTVDFPQGNSVFVCVVVLRPRLTSMVMSGRLVNLTKLFLDRLRPSCKYFR